MECWPKESEWDQSNIEEAPVEKSMSNEEVETSNSKSSTSSSKKKGVCHKSPEKVKCAVDGCNYDMGTCREYHRRHRVCQPHSKTSCVLVKGQEQRFCQQCSRFQSLDEFDGYKRSCRRRLEGHNKRRRKPRPPPLAFSEDYKGPRILQFGNPTSNDRYMSVWGAQSSGIYHHYPPILPKVEIDQLSLKGSGLSNIENMQVNWYGNNNNNNNEPVLPLAAEAGIGEQNKRMPLNSALYLLSTFQAQSSSEFSMVESSIDCPSQSQPPFEEDRLMVKSNEREYDQNGMLQVEPQMMEQEAGASLTFPFFWE